MKKIAIALNEDKTTVSSHFGTCGAYLLVEAEGEKVLTRKEVENPHGSHQGGCAVPDYINSLGANVIITGGMGMKAIEKCNNYGIEVILGNTGPVDTVLDAYLKGELKSQGSACEHHHGCS